MTREQFDKNYSRNMALEEAALIVEKPLLTNGIWRRADELRAAEIRALKLIGDAPSASSATAFTEERLRLIARKHAHDACNPINALDPASVQEEFRCQEIIFYALKEAAASDTARLDWLERVKDAHFEPLNHHAKAISKVKLFTVETQSVVGNTAREAIDLAMAREQFDIHREGKS